MIDHAADWADMNGVEAITLDDHVLMHADIHSAPPPLELTASVGSHVVFFEGKYVDARGFGFKLKSEYRLTCEARSRETVHLVPTMERIDASPFERFDVQWHLGSTP